MTIDGSTPNANGARWPVDGGHYESWFIRANHATRPLAFWIRYTIFAPSNRPTDGAQGELWAIWFDGDARTISAAYSAIPIADCAFSQTGLQATIGSAALNEESATGTAEGLGHRIAWDLSMRNGSPPLLLFPRRFYESAFPKAKSLVPRPRARFDGHIDVDGTQFKVADWLGSQNHNWGSAHTDRYAWAQVAGFDTREDAFLECASAKVRLGPFMSPWMTLAVLRLGGEELIFNSPTRWPFGHARVDNSVWSCRTTNGRESLSVRVWADNDQFVDLKYRNPPGGTKLCRNTKVAACELELARQGAPLVKLSTEHRAAFELLT